MNDSLQGFVQLLINCQAGTTVEQKLSSLKAAREYVLYQNPQVDILCMNTVLNLQAYGQFVLFEAICQLIEGIVSVQPRVEILLPMFDFFERIEYNYEESWLVTVLNSLSVIFQHILSHILSGRGGPLGSSWHLCWQKMSCLGQSLAVKSLTSTCLELQLNGLNFMQTVVLMYSEAALLQTAGSGRGSPSADMLLSNCRYLIGQLVEQLDAERFAMIHSSAPVVLIQSLAQIASQREQFLHSILPPMVKLVEKGQYKIPTALGHTSKSDSYSVSLANALKQALLRIMKGKITKRQRSSILEGLCLLGGKLTPSHEENPAESEVPQQPHHEAKRVKRESVMLSERDATSSLSSCEVTDEQKSSVFGEKLDLEEIQSILEILIRKGYNQCVGKLCQMLPNELVVNLVVHNFSAAPDLPESSKSVKVFASDSSLKLHLEERKGSVLAASLEEKQKRLNAPLQPMEMSPSDRLILMEYSTSKLLKINPNITVKEDDDALPLAMQILSRLSALQGSASTTIDVPMDLILQFISAHFENEAYLVNGVILHLMFELFVKHGNSAETQSEGFEEQMEFQNFYDRTLFQIFEKLSEQRFRSKDKSMQNLLMELPLLPPNIVQNFFMKMLRKDALTASSFLITAVALMESRPLLKTVLLQCVLETCISLDPDIREKAIRLVKNRLHVDPELQEKIEDFATNNLKSLIHYQEEMVDVGRFCHLYLALCTRKASLLRTLLEVYAEANELGKLAIQENTKQLSEAIPFLLSEILSLIHALPVGSEKLLLLLLSIFPDQVPPPRVVDACLEQYQTSKNIRFLVPILPGLSKKRIMEIIPLLTELSLEEFSPIITDLVRKSQFGEEAIEPSEVLISLMISADSPEALTTVRAALDHCIKQLATVFDKEVLAGTLNKLVHMTTLPMLFMRTVLLSISREKELGSFVLQSVLSPSVVAGKIKAEANQWKGYLLLLQRLIPAAFSHLLSLPTRLMTLALQELPRSFIEQFGNFVNSEESNMRVSKDALLAIEQCLAGNVATEVSSKMTSSSQRAPSDHEVNESVEKQSEDEDNEAQSRQD